MNLRKIADDLVESYERQRYNDWFDAVYMNDGGEDGIFGELDEEDFPVGDDDCSFMAEL